MTANILCSPYPITETFRSGIKRRIYGYWTSGDLRELSEVNSDDTESFHNWSSNSRWFVFSSRRGDGLYTRLYLASMDENGKISKPFLLPQEDPETYYDRSVYSYNVPDFVNAPILLDTKVFEKRITSKERIQVQVGD